MNRLLDSDDVSIAPGDAENISDCGVRGSISIFHKLTSPNFSTCAGFPVFASDSSSIDIPSSTD